MNLETSSVLEVACSDWHTSHCINIFFLVCCSEEPSTKQRRLDSNEDGSKRSADKSTSKEKAEPFPFIMMRIIEEDVSEATMWNTAGDIFCVQAQQFKDNLLEKYFPGTKFESFTRKLNRWGFRRVVDQQKEFPRGAHVYNHPLFQRDKPELVVDVTANRQRSDLATLERLLAGEQIASLARQQRLAATAGLTSDIPHVGGGKPVYYVHGNSTHASLLQAALSAGALSSNPVPPDLSLLALQRTVASTRLELPSSSSLIRNLVTDAGSLVSHPAINNNSNLLNQVARRREERQRGTLLLQLRLRQQQQQQEDAMRIMLFRGSFNN